jgi:hypothetical protein
MDFNGVKFSEIVYGIGLDTDALFHCFSRGSDTADRAI